MAWNTTALHMWEPFPDPRADIIAPVLSRLKQMQLAKLCVEHIPGASEVFKRQFGAPRSSIPLGLQPVVYTGVPAFLWTQR